MIPFTFVLFWNFFGITDSKISFYLIGVLRSGIGGTVGWVEVGFAVGVIDSW
jgi:hypothetical protein